MDLPLTLTTAEVAAALAIGVDRFHHKKASLYAAGFPRPLPGAPGRWSRQLVAGWIAAGGRPGAPAGTEAGFVADQRRALEARYQGRRA